MHNLKYNDRGGLYMKGIITVVGVDHVGIIAKVCLLLADENVNILDISQTIVQGYFTMMMVVDASTAEIPFEDLVVKLEEAGEEIGVVVRLQHEDIFNTMHRI